MKDYYLSNKESADYITTYDIKEDTIQLHLASKKKPLLLKNTHENRKKICQKMDNQIEKGYRYSKYRIIIVIILFCLNLSGCIEFPSLFFLITFIGNIIIIPYFGYGFLDAKKNYNFYKNRNELNSQLEKDPNLLEGIKEKTKEMLVNQPKEEQIFNYNSIDRLTYLELRKILLNLKLARSLNFEYVESQNQFIQEEAIRRNRANKKIVPFSRES